MSRDRSNTISRERERPAIPADRIAARREVAPTFGDGFPRVAGGQDGSPRPLASLSTDELEPTPLFPVERSLSETTPPIDPAELRKFRAVPADAARGDGAFANTAVTAPVPPRSAAGEIPREPRPSAAKTRLSPARELPREARPSDAQTRLTAAGGADAERNGASAFAETQITPQDPREVRESAAARAEQRLAHQNPEVARLAEALRADQGALADAYAETLITDPAARAGRELETSTERWLRAIDERGDAPPVAGGRAQATPANPWRTAPPTPTPGEEPSAALDPDAVTRATGLENTVVPPPRSRTGDDVLEVALDDLIGEDEHRIRPPALPTAPVVAPRAPELEPAVTPARAMSVAATRAEQRELAQRLAQDSTDKQPLVAPPTPQTTGELDVATALGRVAAIPPLAWVGAISFVAVLVWLFTM